MKSKRNTLTYPNEFITMATSNWGGTCSKLIWKMKIPRPTYHCINEVQSSLKRGRNKFNICLKMALFYYWISPIELQIYSSTRNIVVSDSALTIGGWIKRRSRPIIHSLSLRNCSNVLAVPGCSEKSIWNQGIVRSQSATKTFTKTRLRLFGVFFQYLVMSYGVTSALAQFMGMTNDLLGEFLDIFVLVLLHDIPLYSQFMEEGSGH